MGFYDPFNSKIVYIDITTFITNKTIFFCFFNTCTCKTKCKYAMYTGMFSSTHTGGNGGRVITLSPPTSEARVRFPALPQVRKLVVACRWSAVYSTEP